MTRAEYRKLVVEHRKRQLRITQENIERLERVFDRAAQSLAHKLESAPEESLSRDYLTALLSDIDAILAALRSDFAGLLTVAMTDAAQAAASREAATAHLAGVLEDPRLRANTAQALTLSDGKTVSVQFGIVARTAVERCASRVWSDGFKLSDRLYKLDQATRQVIGDTIVQGVAEQISAREMARRLEGSLSEAGADNPRYKAMRIARTEINTAHREAHIQSTLDPNSGKLKDYIRGIGWRLSLSHSTPDLCDIYASYDGDGLGPGNYLPGNVPSSHPHCLCMTITLLKDVESVGLPVKKPNTSDVPESEARYHAGQGDPAAAQWLKDKEKS